MHWVREALNMPYWIPRRLLAHVNITSALGANLWVSFKNRKRSMYAVHSSLAA